MTEQPNNGQKSQGSWLVRRAAEVAGWTLVALGIAALVLPGPGLLTIVAGLALLATRYTWAERLLTPVRVRAYQLAKRGVQTWPRIIGSTLGALGLVAIGIVWGIGLPVPDWWPLDRRLWLAGEWLTGVVLIASGAFALALIAYSYGRFRRHAVEDGTGEPHDPAEGTL